MEVSLSSFVAGVRIEAESAFAAAVRDLLRAPDASIAFARRGRPLGPEPTQVDIRGGRGGLLRLLLRRDGDPAWRAGPLSVTVERAVDGRRPDDAESRRWLSRLARWFAGSDDRLPFAAAHHRWATAQGLDDRYYRHLELATDGMHASLRPSFRCIQDCHFCWEGRDWPDPPEALVREWLDAMRGAPRLTLCGGEPTFAPGFLDLVDRATHVHGMQVHVNTNGIRFAQPAFLARAVAAGVSTALVSLHSADPTVSDAMTRTPGTHRRTVAGIHAALAAGIRVVVNCVVEAANVDGLADHARFVCDAFVDGHPTNPLWAVEYSQPGPYHDAARHQSAMVPIDVARDRITEAAAVLRARGVLLELTHTCGFPACIASEARDSVHWRLTTALDEGDLRARVHDPAPCRSCAARDRCVGVRREYVAQWGDRGLVPFVTPPWGV